MRKLKRVISVICVAAMIMSLSACGSYRSSSRVSTEEFDWPTSGLATMLPEPETHTGEIKANSDSSFHAEISLITEADYEDYIDACESEGYTIETDQSNSSFQAYNEDGYKVRLNYSSSKEYYNIYLDEPVIPDGSTFNWPTIGLATLLPEPSTNVGKINTDSSTKFSVFVGEFSTDDFNNYVDECIAAGFDNDYNRSEHKYTALNANGDELTISYEGFNVYCIKVEAPDEEKADAEENVEEEIVTDEENEEALEEEEVVEEVVASDEISESAATESADTSSEKSSSNSAGVSDEFKDAMDTYEDFFDSYVEFMKKYNESSDPGSMLSDLSDYMAKYTETMEKLDALEDEMSPAELKYYTEVMGRINKKLAELY